MQMAQTKESGHAKNLAHLQNFIKYASNLGPKYNPAVEEIQIEALKTLHASASASLLALKAAKSAYETATNDREESFKKLRPTATKVVNLLAVFNVYQTTVDDARKSYNKMIGKRAGTIAAPVMEAATVDSTGTTTSTEELPRRISVSQQSYDKQVDHLEQLIATLSAEPKYVPNEPEYSIAGLTELCNELKDRNLNVINTRADFATTRVARDRIFDAEKTGLVDIAMQVKTYIKAICGPTSVDYSQFAAHKFVKRSA